MPQVNELWNEGQSKLNLNPRNKDNATPLQVAAEKQHLPVVIRLIELGADLNTKKNDCSTPLYTAAYNGDYNTVVLLCSKGADVDAANEEDWTPLHAACAQGHLKVVEAMVQDFHAKGESLSMTGKLITHFFFLVNVINDQGTTPFFHAVATGRKKLVEFLVSHSKMNCSNWFLTSKFDCF